MSNRRQQAKPHLTQVNVRLFSSDVDHLRRVASAQGLPWSIELRALVHRAVKGDRRDVLVLKE